MVFLACIGGYALLQNSSRNSTYHGERFALRVGIPKSGGEHSGLVTIADTKGYFVDEGLDVSLTEEEDGVAILNSLHAGRDDIVVTVDLPFVNDSFVSTSTKIISTINLSNTINVIARRDAGISSPNDLKGKKIGVVSHTDSEFFLQRFLLLSEVSRTEVTIVPITYPTAMEAIMSGAVDAVIINDPSAYNISKALGTNGVSWPAQYGRPVIFIAVSNDTFIHSHPQVIERFLRALVRAQDFIKSNPDQAKQIVREHFGFTQKYIDKVWGDNTFSVQIDQSILPVMEAEAQWLQSNKAVGSTTIPNYLERIYLDGVSAIAPKGVNVIR